MFLSTECSKIQTLVTTIVTMQEKKQNFYLFVVMKFCPPTPWKPKFLPNDDRICKYLNTYLFIRHGTIVLSLQDQHLELNNSVLGRQSIGIYGPYSQHSFDGKFSKLNQVIYSSAPISIPNMKALAQILFEISCTQDFQILLSKGHNSEKGHNSDMKKNTGQLFFHEEYTHEISKPYHSPFKS